MCSEILAVDSCIVFAGTEFSIFNIIAARNSMVGRQNKSEREREKERERERERIGTSKQASAEHRKTVCLHARHAHIAMHSAKQHRRRACDTKQAVHWPQADFAMRSARVVQEAILPRWICAYK